MRKFRFAIAAAALLFTGFSSFAQTADEIIQKHIAAIGGADNWKKVTSLKATGNINAGGMQIPVSMTTVQGKGQKVEFTINGMTGYGIITPTTGWAYSPMQGQTKPEAIPDEMVKESQDQLDVQGVLIGYKDKGCKVTYLGKDQVEGTECHKLKVVHKSGKEETMYFDASNYYHIRSVEKSKANGKEVELTSNYGNFQKLPEGIVFPMSVESEDGPIAFTSVEVNKPVDEAIFKPSEAANKPAAK
jgi:hypothetical protein